LEVLFERRADVFCRDPGGRHPVSRLTTCHTCWPRSSPARSGASRCGSPPPTPDSGGWAQPRPATSTARAPIPATIGDGNGQEQQMEANHVDLAQRGLRKSGACPREPSGRRPFITCCAIPGATPIHKPVRAEPARWV
jgi:hypothetical protein